MSVKSNQTVDKKTIVITGSTRGIGRGLAVQFLKRNHQVIINGRTNESVNKTVTEFKNQGYETLGIAGDITDEFTLQTIIEKAVANFKKIDIWINNAGIPQPHRNFIELDKNEMENVISVNILGLMMGTKAAINFFKQQGYGKVFNMEGFGSDGRMRDKLTVYGTSKRAVNYFTRSVSKEIKDENIQMGILSPGMVRTEFLTTSMSAGNAEDQARFQKVLDIMAEDVNVVTEFLVNKILVSTNHYDRIEFLSFGRLLPKLVRLMFVR